MKSAADIVAVADTLENTRRHLLGMRGADGRWRGELSTSALSTATAVLALHVVDPDEHAGLIKKAVHWLECHQNEDGGWGDTTESFSNISTSLLVAAALSRADGSPEVRARAASHIRAACGSLDPAAISRTVVARYGKDRTFSVPILMACALGGLLGDNAPSAWKRVLPLPFELAAFPRGWFAALRLPVVSYALPALIAIGYARYFHAPPSGMLAPLRLLREKLWPRVSILLASIQPESGGFLEAAPLTSFVAMALAGSDQHDHPVVANAVRFLQETVRPDGSWPIDTNLSTWTTTLSIKALFEPNSGDTAPAEPDRRRLIDHLIETQYDARHKFTDAAPGGWAWTDLSGGVPDADDTAGALLALLLLEPCSASPTVPVRNAAINGVRWLLDLQNRDGGIPTFCRGWGALPFDRSSPDLTAHAQRAWLAWLPHLPAELASETRWAMRAGLRYLTNTQNDDGSWIPLWFGNQHRPDETNPVYGTAMVVKALTQLPPDSHIDLESMLNRAAKWLADNQNTDGGWGAGERENTNGFAGRKPTTGISSTLEETALALDALASISDTPPAPITRAAEFLAAATATGTRFPPSPIGFYFAKLWYSEQIYPVAWTLGALNQHQTVISNAFRKRRNSQKP